MTDAEPSEASAYRKQVEAATANLRDTAKWISGGVAVAVGGVLAGSALSGLGSVEPPDRLALAIGGAAVGLGALGLILWRAIDVLAARRLGLRALTDGAIVPEATRREIERDLAEMFPRNVTGYPGYVPGFKALDELMARVRERIRNPDPTVQQQARAEADKINKALAFLIPAATFEELRHRFLALRTVIFRAGIASFLGLGVYAWAGNPPKEEALLKAPIQRSVRLDATEQLVLKSKWPDPQCAGLDLALLEVRVRVSGRSDVVTVPTDHCPSVLLLYRDGKLFAP